MSFFFIKEKSKPGEIFCNECRFCEYYDGFCPPVSATDDLLHEFICKKTAVYEQEYERTFFTKTKKTRLVSAELCKIKNKNNDCMEYEQSR